MDYNGASVFIVDDDPEICRSFRWLFESINLPVETYSNGKAFLDNYNNQHGCLIVDVRMPIMSGLELIEQLHLAKNHLFIIVITGYGDIPMAVRAMKAGAADFIVKPINHQHLLEVTQNHLKQVKKPETCLKGDFMQRLNTLTKREKEVFDLIFEGKLNKQIAYELDISISTVEVHRSKVMRKMKVRSLVELIKINMLHAKTA